ncbi:MAG: hypothetical protein JWM53_615 [bacterium]|nr:hypothetical protein [bacterium]
MSEREIKPAGKAADAGAQAADASEQKQAAPQSRDPRQAKWQAVVKGATAYNEAHADLVAEFLKVAPNCAGDNAGVSVREVRKWQMEHGLNPDGKIGPKTIAAAKKETKGKGDGKDEGKEGGEKSDVTFDDKEAGTVEAAPMAEAAVEVGETAGEEKRPEEKEDPSEVGGGLAKEGAEKIGEDMAGEGHGVAVGAAARLALVPHIVNLLRAHKFGDAVKYVLETISFQERAEILKAVAEKIGGELSEHALQIFEHACLVGLVADVLKAGWEWTYGGIKAVQEAHEAGDRDSRIGIYAWAWSDCVLKGSHDNPGAVDEQQREAMKLGIEDGLATRDQSPELAFLLIAEYGSESNARHALEDALLKRAGISGIKTHAGR